MTWAEREREHRRDYQRKRRAQRKQLVLNAYGNACTCCGETEPKFLCIDHLNDDGAIHRELIGQGRSSDGRRKVGSGSIMIEWLIKNDFPPGFQILCANCNTAKQAGGCPHVDVAQQVEHVLAKDDVAGSNPVIHSHGLMV